MHNIFRSFSKREQIKFTILKIIHHNLQVAVRGMKSIAEFGNRFFSYTSKCVAFVSMDAASLYYSRYLIHRASPILHTFIQFIAIYINSHTKIIL